jgi:hypothetical protein
MSLEEVAQWPDLLSIVRERVKPERDRAKDHGPGKHGKKYWWQFTLRRDPLYAGIAALPRCLIAAITTKHLAFSFQPPRQVFAHTLVVFALDRYSHFACLQSRIHELWALLLSSALGNTLRYSTNDCFDTFPFPLSNPRAVTPSLEATGQAFYETRARYMVSTGQGLTKAHNRLRDPHNKNPEILNLRRLHEVMDQAVVEAYGWSDVEIPPYCPMNDTQRMLASCFADEVVDRLYALNAERANEELRSRPLADGTRRSMPTGFQEGLF